MSQALVSLLGSPELMLQNISSEMKTRGLAEGLVCDHICYRVASEERYQELEGCSSESTGSTSRQITPSRWHLSSARTPRSGTGW